MTIRQTFLAVSAIALLGASAAQAEPYDGVLAAPQGRSRADIMHDAVRAAQASDQNVVRGSRGADAMAVSQDRATVMAEAVRAASAPHQNVSAGSRVNSRVVTAPREPVDWRAVGDATGRL